MKIWVTENNVVHHRKPRSVATVEYVQAIELAEAVKVIELCETALSGDWDDQRDFVAKYREAITRARDFLAKIGEQNEH
jgi:hypothetical protein